MGRFRRRTSRTPESDRGGALVRERDSGEAAASDSGLFPTLRGEVVATSLGGANIQDSILDFPVKRDSFEWISTPNGLKSMLFE
jgi:hypothetical protein